MESKRLIARCARFRTVTAMALFLLVAGFFAPGLVLSQDKPETPPDEPEEKGRPGNAEGYNEYFEITEATYVPASGEGGHQTIQLKLNIATDVPKGCKIRLGMELFALPADETEYVLKDENRKGLTFTWKPKQHLATGEYRLRTHIDLENQTPAVQRILKQNAKVFPPKSAPWSWYSKTIVKIGSPEDEAKEAEAICEAYTAMLDKLVANWKEFKEKLESVKAGKELVNGGVLDATKLEAYVKEWREKQGGVQKEIREFPVKEPGLIQKSQTAQVQITALGRMVSKASVQIQKEATDQYKAPLINPVVKDFDRNFPYKATEQVLQKSYEAIRKAAGCADEAEGAEGAAEDAKPADVDPAGGGDSKDPPKGGASKGDEPGPDKKAAKKPEKKAK